MEKLCNFHSNGKSVSRKGAKDREGAKQPAKSGNFGPAVFCDSAPLWVIKSWCLCDFWRLCGLSSLGAFGGHWALPPSRAFATLREILCFFSPSHQKLPKTAGFML
ncbi:MAG: hypothetical protein DMG21_01720 [Acidobacteria bacterium]|nr:MAG: hypothetical protein DMG21_01720 [Acidobacteriota bacterium]